MIGIFLQILIKISIFQINLIYSLILNDVIIVGENNYRYVDFVTTSKGITFLETTAEPGDTGRIFYGINPNGSGFFLDSLGQKYYILKKQSINDNRKEFAVDYIKINSDNSDFSNKEYLISLSSNIIEFCYYEDFDKNFQVENTKNFFSSFDDKTLVWTSGHIIENNINYFYLGHLLYNGTYYNFHIERYSFKVSQSNQNIYVNKINEYKVQSLDKKIASCYMTEYPYIICLMYYYELIKYKENGIQKSYLHNYYAAFVFNKDLTVYINGVFDSIEDTSTKYFFKAIHIKEELGCFIYYISNNGPPIFKVIGINHEFRQFQLVSFNNFEKLSDQYSYNSDVLLNDLIKMSNKLICFASSTNDKLKLIISLINLNGKDNLTIRYYIINIDELIKYKFLFDIKLHLYNQYIAFASSVCPNYIDCNSNENTHFSILMLFNYPNATEIELDIINYLSNNIQNYTLFNISEKGIIDNNIFGYIIYGTKIINICENDFNLIIKETEEALTKNKIVLKDELIKLELFEARYNKMNCKIEYQIIITEPNYEIFNSFSDKIETFYFENTEDYYWNQTYYYGKINDYILVLSDNIFTSGCAEFCDICYSSNISKCITCKYNTDFSNIFPSGERQKICGNLEGNDIQSSEIIKSEETNLKIEEITDSEGKEEQKNEITYIENTLSQTNIINNSEESELMKVDINYNYCTAERIVQNLCIYMILKDKEILDIYDEIKNEYIIKNKTKEILGMSKNAIFEVTKSSEFKNLNDPNISSIDLGQCENELKRFNDIPEEEPLIIFKIDFKNEDFSKVYVQYEIFNPYTLEQLDLSVCNDFQIDINIPVILDPKTELLYKSLRDSSYNLFDSNDSFYNDICTPFTSENKTDVILEDRINDIYIPNQNKSLCQDGCLFNDYNLTNKKADCKCKIQKGNMITNTTEINFSSINFKKSFFVTIKNSNFMVVKCYKLLLDTSKLIKNIGFIIMTILLIFSITLIFVHFFTARKKILYFFNLILKKFFSKEDNIKRKKANKKKVPSLKEKNKNKIKINKIKEKKMTKFEKKKASKNLNIKIQKKNLEYNKKYNISKKKINVPPKKKGKFEENAEKSNDNNSIWRLNKEKKT